MVLWVQAFGTGVLCICGATWPENTLVDNGDKVYVCVHSVVSIILWERGFVPLTMRICYLFSYLFTPIARL